MPRPRKSDEEKKDNRKIYLEKYRKENKEKILEYHRKYREKEKEKSRERIKKYRQKIKKLVSEDKEFGNKWRKNECLKRSRYREQYRAKWDKIIRELGYDKCSMCGYSKCLAAIDYHHEIEKQENQKNRVGAMRNRAPTEKRINILKTLIPVCSNCHREIHYGGIML